MPSLVQHPSLLAHTIYQALGFDASLKEAGFSLTETILGRQSGIKDWEGISSVILDRKEWFDHWMEGEKTCLYLLREIVEYSSDYIYSCSRSV